MRGFLHQLFIQGPDDSREDPEGQKSASKYKFYLGTGFKAGSGHAGPEWFPGRSYRDRSEAGRERLRILYRKQPVTPDRCRVSQNEQQELSGQVRNEECKRVSGQPGDCGRGRNNGKDYGSEESGNAVPRDRNT